MGEVEGGYRLDGHTMKKGFQNEPQGNGGEQFPEITRPLKTCRREDQVYLTLKKKKKQSSYLRTTNLPASKMVASG